MRCGQAEGCAVGCTLASHLCFHLLAAWRKKAGLEHESVELPRVGVEFLDTYKGSIFRFHAELALTFGCPNSCFLQ